MGYMTSQEWNDQQNYDVIIIEPSGQNQSKPNLEVLVSWHVTSQEWEIKQRHDVY